MADRRFDDRLKRIAVRKRGGPHAELLAGVGDLSDARAAAGAQPPSASFLLIILGALTGFLGFDILDDMLGLNALLAMTPSALFALAKIEPRIAVASGALGICAFMALYSFIRGRNAAGMMSFSFSAIGAALGGAVATV